MLKNKLVCISIVDNVQLPPQMTLALVSVRPCMLVSSYLVSADEVGCEQENYLG